MDILSWLQEVAILIVVYEITAAESDLLETFRPKENNPPELNEFLSSVMEHKDEFGVVRQAARKYQKMKKDIQDVDLSFIDPIMDSKYKFEDKRHIHHNNVHGKFRNLGLLPPNMRNKFHRIRRTLKDLNEQTSLENDEENEKTPIEKRFPAIIMLQGDDDMVQKRMPSPMLMKPAEKRTEKHIPSDIFNEPEIEQLQKRTAEEIVVEPEGEKGRVIQDDETEASKKEKKQAIDFDQEVHRTYKSNAGKGMRNDMRVNKQGDVYYVDLEDAARKENDRYNDRRAYQWDPRSREYYLTNHKRMYNRPYMGRPQAQMDYPQFEGRHHSLNDEVAFEKALSYEIDPTYHEVNYNNPSGNSLYNVDEGRPDAIQFYSQGFYPPRAQAMGRYDYPPQDPLAVTNERFYIDADDNMRRFETTSTDGTTSSTSSTTGATTDEKNGLKTVKQVGNGFLEVTKTRRDNEEELEVPLAKKSLSSSEIEDSFKQDDEQPAKNTFDKSKERSSILAKHSLHPLRIKDTSRDEEEDSFVNNEEVEDQDSSHSIDKRDLKGVENRLQTRKLQFSDYETPNAYNQEDNYEDMPNRPRRDFLDALGMKNEEDYSEDNPYRDDLNTNNTDVNNDTHIQNGTTHYKCGSTTIKSTTSHQKEDITKIQHILEEPKETTTEAGKCKKKKEEKRLRKSFPEYAYFDDVEKSEDEVRRSRGTGKEIEKILANKEKIYVPQDVHKSNHVQTRQDRPVAKWAEDPAKLNSLKYISHTINKKEDSELPEITELPELTESTVELFESTTTAPNCTTESDKLINTAYEQIANQMDVENEKLAQVVNGHLASKIVSKVFCQLKKKSSLKAKFYSGLSRKHVNFAGTIDFDIFKTNETEDVDEARLLLAQITKVLNKLVVNQVRRKLCQRLPDELKEYLEIILNVKNLLETTNFVPNNQQGDFLFTYQEDKNAIPFDVTQLQGILIKLEGLLLSYSNMNEDCQNRAEPVKDYIEKHIKMLKQIVNCPTHHCEDKFSETKRESPTVHRHLLEEQLKSVGLGKNQEFIPNFDLNQMVRNKMRTVTLKKDRKRDTQKSSDSKSAQYKKLQLAAQKVREKRENEKKIAELFGGKQKRSVTKDDVDYEEPVVYSLG